MCTLSVHDGLPQLEKEKEALVSKGFKSIHTSQKDNNS